MDTLVLDDIQKVVESVDERMMYFGEIGTPIIEFYTKDLDNLMLKIREMLNSASPENLNINELQYHFIQLTNELYFTAFNVEKIGLLMDLSNLSYKDAFNTSLITNSSKDSKLTVAKLNALADKESLADNVVNFIYSRTYKILKSKIDSTNEMIKTLSKLISYRMQTSQISGEDKFDIATKRLLMEG